MKRISLDTNPSAMEPFLAIERELLPEASDVRERVMARARASASSRAALPVVVTPRRVRVGMATAAGVVLVAMCAAAFLAGYRIRNRTVESNNRPPVLVPSVIVQQVPSQAVVVALVPVASHVSRVAANFDTVGSSKPNPGVSAKSAVDIESYTKELRVLQPARQAVARQDFNTALSAIAEHQRLFPSGKLTEEREALRVKALLGLGRNAEARRAGSAFRTNFPRSALLGRIEEMLGNQK